MNNVSAPGPDGTEASRRLDNGLLATSYVPLTDVDPVLGPHLLTALGRARIAAYLDDSPQPAGPNSARSGASRCSCTRRT